MLDQKTLAAATLAAAFLCLPSPSHAQVQQFSVDSTGGSRVIFESDAPLETITGVSSSAGGEISVDPTNLSTARGRIEVPIASLRTGVDLRDEHLRADNWLDAQRHPNATFEIISISGATALQAGATANVRVRGRFTLHGVTREITAPAQLRYQPGANGQGGTIMVRTRFTVNLPQHNVSVPAIVRLKVSDEISVRVSLRLNQAPARQATAR